MSSLSLFINIKLVYRPKLKRETIRTQELFAHSIFICLYWLKNKICFVLIRILWFTVCRPLALLLVCSMWIVYRIALDRSQARWLNNMDHAATTWNENSRSSREDLEKKLIKMKFLCFSSDNYGLSICKTAMNDWESGLCIWFFVHCWQINLFDDQLFFII